MKSRLFAVMILALWTVAWAPVADPMSVALSSASAAGRPVLVEFVAKTSAHVARIDAEHYRDASVLGVLNARYSRGPVTLQVNQPAPHAGVVHQPGLTTDGLRREENSYRPLALHPVAGVMRIAVEDYPEVCERWKVRGYPTFVVVSPEGSVVARHEGLLEPNELASFLSSAAACCAPAPAVAIAAPVPVASPAAELTAVSWTQALPAEPVVLARTAEPVASPAPSVPASPAERSPSAASSSPRRESLSGRFESEARKEFLYERTFDAPTLWTIDLRCMPEDFDVDLEVLDANGTSLILSEGQAGEEHITLAAAAGVAYTIRVFSFRGDPTGVSFELKERREALPADRVTPGYEPSVNAEGEAVNLRLMRTVPYWVRYSVAPPGTYRFTFNTEGVSGGTLDAAVITADGRLLGSLSGGVVIADVPQAGRVFLRVSPASGSPRGSLSVSMERFTVIDAAAVQDSLRPGQTVTGQVGGRAGNEHLYRVRPREEGAWEFVLEGQEEGADIDVEVLLPDGTLVERAESPTGQEKLRVELPADEERFVRVYVYRANQPVRYTLAMNEAGPAEDGTEPPAENEIVPPADAARLSASSPASGEVSQNGTAWYRIEVPRAGLVAVLLDGGAASQDIDLAIHKADGTRVALSQSDSGREAVLVDAEPGAALFVRVYAYGESRGGRYRVWYQAVDR